MLLRPARFFERQFIVFHFLLLWGTVYVPLITARMRRMEAPGNFLEA
jgi:hypothetical protein